MVVCLRERSRSCPDLVQEGSEVLRISGQSFIILGSRDVRHIHLLPGLRFISFEYLVERLPQDVTSDTAEHAWLESTYLSVARNREGSILQFLGRQVCQNIRNVSGDVGSGSERNLLVAITANGYFSAFDIEVHPPALGLLIERQRTDSKRRTGSKWCRRMVRCRRGHTVCPPLSAGRELWPSRRKVPLFLPLLDPRIQMGRTTWRRLPSQLRRFSPVRQNPWFQWWR